MEYPLWSSGRELYYQHCPSIGSVENRSPITGPPQGRFSARVPVVEEEASNTRQSSSIPNGLGTATTPRLVEISSDRGNINGVKSLFGHRRSSRLQENIFLKP